MQIGCDDDAQGDAELTEDARGRHRFVAGHARHRFEDDAIGRHAELDERQLHRLRLGNHVVAARRTSGADDPGPVEDVENARRFEHARCAAEGEDANLSRAAVDGPRAGAEHDDCRCTTWSVGFLERLKAVSQRPARDARDRVNGCGQIDEQQRREPALRPLRRRRDEQRHDSGEQSEDEAGDGSKCSEED